MATDNSSSVIPAPDCKTVDVQHDKNSGPVQLCIFMEDLSLHETLRKTTDYVQDREAYLRNKLGEQTFKERKHLFSLAEKLDVDKYGTSEYMQHFEQHIATNVLGKQHGLFFITGVQAQLAAVKVHCEKVGKMKAAWHVSCHLESAEEDSYNTLYGLERQLLGGDAESLPSIEEIMIELEKPEADRPAVIVIEVPNRVLGCQTYSFAELEQISAMCETAGVALHMDGARLWEIEPYYQATAGVSFADVAKLFDSVYVSFYKGLRGCAGAMLSSNDEEFVKSAKVWRRRAGGNAFCFSYEIADCERGFNETIGTFGRKREKMMRIVDAVMKATEEFRAPDGQRIVNFNPGKATCCQIHTVFKGFSAAELIAARDTVQEKTRVRIFERLRPKRTVAEQAEDERVAKDLASKPYGEGIPESVDRKRHFVEWMINSITVSIEEHVFVDAYVALCKELVTASHE